MCIEVKLLVLDTIELQPTHNQTFNNESIFDCLKIKKFFLKNLLKLKTYHRSHKFAKPIDSGKPKICYFYLPIFSNKNILWLDISMNYSINV